MSRALNVHHAPPANNLKGRLMKLGYPTNGPFSFVGLYLISGVRMQGFLSKRQPIVNAVSLATGEAVSFSVGVEFALTLFSNRRML